MTDHLNATVVLVDSGRTQAACIAHYLSAVIPAVEDWRLHRFRLHAVRNVTTVEGGALTWRADLPVDQGDLERRVRRLTLQGQDRAALTNLTTGAWDYDIVELGYKMNMPDTLAALGLSLLRRYKVSVDRRHELLGAYLAADLPVTFVEHESTAYRSSAHLAMTCLPEHLSDRRNDVIRYMGEAGVATNVHFKPLPLMTAYRAKGFDIADYPNAHALQPEYQGL